MKLKSNIGIALLALALAASANAASITGVISFDGTATLDTTDLATATKVNSWSDTNVGTIHTGSFAVLATNSLATFTDGWVFGAGITPLWTAGPFTFNLTSSGIEVQNATSLVVAGTGMITAAGFDPTIGTFRFSTQEPGSGVAFSFSASSAAHVPDGGATVALLGLSFLGLGGVSRLVRRK